jgi:hypothetical protein
MRERQVAMSIPENSKKERNQFKSLKQHVIRHSASVEKDPAALEGAISIGI